jgi:O-antigen/teichoic acid export membrane protein
MVARLAVLACALVSSVLLARILGPEGRGLFALVFLLPELATTFGLLGFDHANVVYAGLEPNSRRALVWHSAVIAAVIGGSIALVLVGCVVFGAPGFDMLQRAPLSYQLITLSIIPFVMVVEYWGSIIRGMNRISLNNKVEMAFKLASVILLSVVLIWLRWGVAGAIITHVTITLAGVVAAVVLLQRVGVWGRPTFDPALWRQTRRFAFPAYLATVLSYLNYRVDQIIIAALLPTEQLGFYVLAVSLAERLWLVTGVVANALLPHLTNSTERDPKISAEVARHVVMWTGLGCVFVFIAADPIVSLLFSSAFTEVVAPLRYLLPGILVASCGKILVGELLARKKVASMVWMTGASAAVNIVGNFVLIPHLGISGAALASTLSYALLSVLQCSYFFWETGVPVSAVFPKRTDFTIYNNLLESFLKRCRIGRHEPKPVG